MSCEAYPCTVRARNFIGSILQIDETLQDMTFRLGILQQQDTELRATAAATTTSNSITVESDFSEKLFTPRNQPGLAMRLMKEVSDLLRVNLLQPVAQVIFMLCFLRSSLMFDTRSSQQRLIWIAQILLKDHLRRLFAVLRGNSFSSFSFVVFLVPGVPSFQTFAWVIA